MTCCFRVVDLRVSIFILLYVFLRQVGTAKKWSRALAVQHTNFLDTQVQVQVMDLVYITSTHSVLQRMALSAKRVF